MQQYSVAPGYKRQYEHPWKPDQINDLSEEPDQQISAQLNNQTTLEDHLVAMQSPGAVMGGMVLVTSVSVGTAVSSVNVVNAFNNSYDNYVVTYSNLGASVNATQLFFRFGTAAVPVTTNYLYSGRAFFYNGVGIADVYNNAAVYWAVGSTHTSNSSGMFHVNGPNLATPSFFNGHWAGSDASFSYSGIQADITQHTSFHLYPSSGTLTGGYINVYGYRKI